MTIPKYCRILCVCLVVCPSYVAAEEAVGQIAIETLIQQLETGDEDTRRVASRQLAELGSAAKSAVAVLAKAAHDRDRQVSSQALEALALIGPDAHEATGRLIELLSERDDQQRYRAAYALGRIGATAIEPLVEVLRSNSDDRARAAAARALGWMGPAAGPAIPELIKLLDRNGELAELATKSLGAIGRDSVDPLVAALGSPVEKVRVGAVSALCLIGPPANSAAPKIEQIMQDQSPLVRARAVEAYGRVTSDSSEAVTVLSAALADSELAVRKAAVETLLRKPESLPSVFPAVQELLSRGPEDVSLAALILGRLGPRANIALDSVLQAVENNHQNESPLAAAISRFGPRAVEPLLRAWSTNRINDSMAREVFARMGSAKSPLRQLMDTDEQQLRRAAARALGYVRPVDDDSVTILVHQLSSSDAEIRMASATGLANMESAALAAQEELRNLAQDPDERVRATALMALFRIGADPAQLSDAILDGISSPLTEMRREATRTLSRFETLEPRHIEALRGALADPDQNVRSNAIIALQKVSEPDDGLIQTVAGLLDDTDPAIRSTALKTLGSFKGRSASVIGKLSEMIGSTDQATQLSVLETLGQIGRDAEPVIDGVQTLLTSQSAPVRAKSIEAISRMANDRELFLSAANKLLDDGDWTVRRQVAGLLAEEGSNAVRAVPKLIERLRIPEDSEFARDALQTIDTAPPESVPVLIQILDEGAHPRVRRVAIYLLKKAGPEAKQALPVLRKMQADPGLEQRAKSFIESAITEIEQK